MKARKSTTKSIQWKSIEAAIHLIDPTPGNYKIKTDLGKARLQQSLKAFGLAGNVVCNPIKGRYQLIDGNSRVEEAKEKGMKKLWVSVPIVPLTPKEYKEMSAMFDVAKAGEVDMERIEGELGTTKDFYDKWNLEVPFKLLEQLGSKQKVKGEEYPEDKAKGKKGKEVEESVDDIRMVQLFFSDKEEAEFRKMAEVLKKQFKVESITDTVFKAFKKLTGKK